MPVLRYDELAAWHFRPRLAAWTTVGASGSKPSYLYQLRHATGIVLALLGLFSVLFGSNNACAQDRPDLDKYLQETEAALAKVDNYTAVFHRIERVNGKLIPEETTFLKFKRPFKVYLRWIKPFAGQESLYVQGTNHNKIRARGTGFASLVAVNLNPTNGLAMKDSRHPITDAGLENLINKIGSNLRRGLRAGELTSIDRGEQTVYCSGDQSPLRRWSEWRWSHRVRHCAWA